MSEIGEEVLLELKRGLGEYLNFLSTDFVVCDVCHEKLRVRDFPDHIELEHYDVPERTWSKRWNQQNRPPLTEKELRAVFGSACHYRRRMKVY